MVTTRIVALTDSTNGWMNAAFLPERLYERYGRTIRWAYNGSYDTPSYGSQATLNYGGSGSDIIDLWSNGVGGAGSGDVDAAAISTLVTAKSPDIILVVLGINDGAAGTGVQANLEALYDDLAAAVPTATIILCSQNPVVTHSGSPDVRDAVQAAAAAKSATFVDVYQTFIDTGDWASYLGDGTHPNDAGKDLYVDVIEPALVATGLLGAEQEASTVAVIDSAELVLRANRYSGSGDWSDESGNGHHATPSGSPTWDGEKFTFNGTDQYFTVPDADALDPGATDFTVVVVTTPAADIAASQWAVVAKRGNAVPAWSVGFALASTTFSGYITDNVTPINLDGPSGSTPSGSQVTVGYVIDRALNQMRLLGVSKNISAVGAVASSTDLTIGRWESGNYYKGDIYGVAIFGTALSDADVAQAGTELLISPLLLLLGVG